MVWLKRDPTWEEAFPRKKRKEYLFQLSEEFVRPYLQNRKIETPHGIHQHEKRAMALISIDFNEEILNADVNKKSRMTCHLCPKTRLHMPTVRLVPPPKKKQFAKTIPQLCLDCFSSRSNDWFWTIDSPLPLLPSLPLFFCVNLNLLITGPQR